MIASRKAKKTYFKSRHWSIEISRMVTLGSECAKKDMANLSTFYADTGLIPETNSFSSHIFYLIHTYRISREGTAPQHVIKTALPFQTRLYARMAIRTIAIYLDGAVNR